MKTTERMEDGSRPRIDTLFLFLVYFAFVALFDRTAEEMTGNGMRESGDDMQQRAAGWTRTPGHRSGDKASVCETP